MPLKKTAYYDDRLFNYNEYWRSREYEDLSEKIALRRMLKLITPKGCVLDIGGGYGRLVPEYVHCFKKCLLIDPSSKLLNQASHLCRKYKNLNIKKGLIEKIPFKDNSLDTVITIRTFHHLDDPSKAINEIARVLKPGGFLILEYANKVRFKNVLKAILKLNFRFILDHRPLNISRKSKGLPFYSYHPNQIKTLLLTNKFKIIKTLSVSNFRRPWIKKVVPLSLLLKMESLFSLIVSSINPFKYFGPSIFLLAQKKKNCV